MSESRWISFHDSDIVEAKLSPGKVTIRVQDAQTNYCGAPPRTYKECEALLECDGVTRLVVDGFTAEYEYVSALEFKTEPEARFRILDASGTTSCAEVKLTVWPTGGAFHVTCTSVTLRLAEESPEQ